MVKVKRGPNNSKYTYYQLTGDNSQCRRCSYMRPGEPRQPVAGKSKYCKDCRVLSERQGRLARRFSHVERVTSGSVHCDESGRIVANDSCSGCRWCPVEAMCLRCGEAVEVAPHARRVRCPECLYVEHLKCDSGDVRGLLATALYRPLPPEKKVEPLRPPKPRGSRVAERLAREVEESTPTNANLTDF